MSSMDDFMSSVPTWYWKYGLFHVKWNKKMGQL